MCILFKVNNEDTRTASVTSCFTVSFDQIFQNFILLTVFCQLTNNKYRFVRISLITNDHTTESGGFFRQKAYKFHGFYMYGL